MKIRNSAKAVVLHDNHLLLVKSVDDEGYFYGLPGGGQEHTETLHDAVRRECLEEAGLHVEVKNLLFVREYIGKNHEFAAFDADLHHVHFVFECTTEEPHAATSGVNPDNNQVSVEWIPLVNLNSIRMYPAAIRSLIIRHSQGESDLPVYVGDMN